MIAISTDRLSRIAAAQVPVFLREDLSPCFMAGGSANPRALILSIPKSGTYLFGQLLKTLGYVDCRVHLNDSGFTDYRFASMERGQREVAHLRATLGLADALSLIDGGQFAVGHLSYDSAIGADVSGFRLLFTHRNLRDAIVSQMRFFAEHGRGTAVTEKWGALADGPDKMRAYLRFHGEFFLQARCARMMRWLEHPGVLAVRYETLMGDFGTDEQHTAVREIAHHLGTDEPTLSEAFFADLLGAKTLTQTGARTQRARFWDDDVEEFFVKYGGSTMNRRLGYEV